MKSGDAYDAAVLTVKKGKCGGTGAAERHGEHGYRHRGTSAEHAAGRLRRDGSGGWKGEPLPTASEEDIHTGEAAILSTVSGDTPREYSVEILKIYPKDRTDGRNLLLKVTDETLLEATGALCRA